MVLYQKLDKVKKMQNNNENNFSLKYKEGLISLIKEIDDNIIKKVIYLLNKVEKSDAMIYVIGNGGSAATATHMENDLGIGLARRKIKNFNIKSLADNSAVCTAIANDIGYENIFYSQLKDKLKQNDILIAISCSGNSTNIIKAVEYAKNEGIKIIGLTGFDGGKLKGISDINYHVDTVSQQYGLVEDLHMIFNHMVYTYFIENKNI